jgi:hypothetical protein
LPGGGTPLGGTPRTSIAAEQSGDIVEVSHDASLTKPRKLMRTRTLLSLLAAFAALPAANAQSAADSAAVRATALDYVEGWYEANGDRMQRALHPELAKRIVDQGAQGSKLGHMGASTLVDYTRRGGGKNTPPDKQVKNVRILDMYKNVAMVRAEMSGWIDFMQIAKWNDRWVIVNVLWEMKGP